MIKRFAALPVLALGIALAVAPVRAQEPPASHLAVARELAQMVGAVASIDDLVPVLMEDIKRQAITRPEMTKDINEVLKLLAPEVELQKQQAVNIAGRVYAKHLSEQELRDLIAFFKTPLGAKYIRVLPDVVSDVVRDLDGWTQQFAEYIQVRTRVEMAKRGHQMQ